MFHFFEKLTNNTIKQNNCTTITKKYTHYISPHLSNLPKLSKYSNLSLVVDIVTTHIYNIYVVYFVNCMVNANYMDWIKNQICYIKDYDAIYISKIATIEPKDEFVFRCKIRELFPTLHIIVECYYENEYEYRGILKVWQLGQLYTSSNDIILYFHSKGVTRNKSYKSNKKDGYNNILKDIDKIKEIFDIFPTVDKIGDCYSSIGFIWYNFWFVRGSYVFFLEKPIKTIHRHYYEDWLARKVDLSDKITYDQSPLHYYPNTAINCYGFHCNVKKNIFNIGSCYNSSTQKFQDL